MTRSHLPTRRGRAPKQFYTEIQRILRDEQPGSFLYHYPDLVLVTDSMRRFIALTRVKQDALLDIFRAKQDRVAVVPGVIADVRGNETLFEFGFGIGDAKE